MRSEIESLPNDLLSQATCAVLNNDGKVKGTAWLVSAQGHLLTAGHLLGTNNPSDKVTIAFPEDNPRDARTIQWMYHHKTGSDFAVLKLTSSINRIPLPVCLEKTVTGSFRVRGYGVTLKNQSTGMGIFLGEFDPQDLSENRLFQLRSPELGEQGYSGAAVISDNLQAAVAIQIEATVTARGASRDTVLAMPLYRIALNWEYLYTLEKQNKLLALEKNIEQNLILLRTYEENRRYEDDPLRRRKFDFEINRLKNLIDKDRDDYQAIYSSLDIDPV